MKVQDILGTNDNQLGDTIELDVALCVINDNKEAEAVQLLNGKTVFDNKKVLVVIDQIIPPNSPEVSKKQKDLMEFANKQNVELHYGFGMTPHLLIEDVVQQGQVVVGSDATISGVGAIGAIGFSVDKETLAKVLETGKLSVKVPAIKEIELTNTLQDGVSAKDLALTLIKTAGLEGFNNSIVNFVGQGVSNLSLDDRLILSSMMDKSGAIAAVVDESSRSGETSFDLSTVKSQVVLEDNYAKIIDPVEIKNTKVNLVYIGGTVGGFLEDIKKVAEKVEGKSIGYGVRMLVSPATSKIYKEAADAGYISAILDAGGLVINQCGNPEVQGRIGEHEVMVSNDIENSNGYAGFASSKIYITSTDVAVDAALEGSIGTTNIVEEKEEESHSSLSFTNRIWKLGDDIDTDIIIPTQYLTLPSMEEMTSHTFEPLRPELASQIKEGDIIVGGNNFGCGSSREMAAEVIAELGIKCIIAKSFARIFFRNAINNGILLIECPELPDEVTEGDTVTVDINNDKIVANGKEYPINKIAENLYEIIMDGGLVKSIMKKVQRGIL